MLRRNSELTAYVVVYKLSEKLVAFVLDKIIKSYSAADKYLFNTIKIAQLSQNVEIFGMRHLHIRAGLWCKTAPVLAKSVLLLLFAGRKSEISRWTAHVAYISFEPRIIYKTFRFIDYAFLAPHRHCSSLMKRKRAEVTCAETASVVGD